MVAVDFFKALAIAAAFIGIGVSAHNGHHKRNLPALDPQLTNSLPTNGGPTLYYNGSGPVPPYDELSPLPAAITPIKSSSVLQSMFYQELSAIINGSFYNTSCGKCIAGTEVMHLAALTQPVSTITNLLIQVCEATGFSIYADSCYEEFSGIGGLGPYWAQLYAKMSMETMDFQAWCAYQWEVCDPPPFIEIDESKYFDPKPESAKVVPVPSGKNINVLHISDWHLDPRYDIGSEADCSQYLCCRPYSTNTKKHTGSNNATVPASRYGYLYCDSPADLALSSFDTMSQFFNPDEVSFTIFTGDIVSHDNDDQLSRAYIEYEETVTYQTFKAQMKNTPIYPTLGNHDSLPEAYNTPNSFNGPSGNALSWNYNLLASMWESDGWISSPEETYAKTHYGAYAHTTKQGLRIISLNSDFWYSSNIFNFANFTNPDNSGVLTFLAQELAAAEKAHQRAWVISHVLSGYDGSNALQPASSLFHAIIARYSPTTVAGVFFGHTHEDQIQIFYDFGANSLKAGTQLRNTSDIDYSSPLNVGYIGPSITPLTGNNAGYQLYQVDAATFSITGVQTYFANVSESLTWSTPEWKFEYDVRDTYAPSIPGGWKAPNPLNASFWDKVATAMQSNQSLVETYNFLETKSSVVTENCSSKACAVQKVCYIRSGNTAQAARCTQDDGPF
ncbi:hypothetical protein MMC25_002551 [Agyrium rufum]|nr:hypothetical protein [Agyrium rufum]